MCKVTKKTVKASASLAALITYAALGIWVTTPSTARAHQEPPGCAGNGSGGTIGVVNGAFHHIGDAVDFTVGVNVPAGQCQGSNITARIRFPDNTFLDYATNLTLNPGGTITCPNAADARCLPGPYRYIVRAQDLGKQTVETNLPNVDCRSPSSSNSVYGVGTASGTDHTGPGTLESTFSDCRNIPITIFQPAIVCTKTCVNGIGQNGTITFSGSVSNSGIGTPLAPVSVSNLVNGVLVLVTNITQLNPGQVVTFGGSYVPANPCVPTTDTIFVRGTDPLGSNVTSQCSATCSNVITPCISVTKNCDGPIVVGGTQTISGVVSNCGNIALTNVVLTDNVIGAVTNIANLPIGGSVAYSKTFTATCNANTNTVTAIGTTICGQNVTNSATAVCQVASTPCIAVTKLCTGPVVVGQPQTISGIVSNCGNITLTNVILDDNVLGAVTNFATLVPGQSFPYSKSFTAGCVGNTNTVTARGTTVCGQNVTNTATTACLVLESPCIQVTKICGSATLVGTTNTVSGVVTNCGNVTLTNIVVSDNVLGAITTITTPLPPGGSTTYSKSYVNGCAPLTNTVTAVGTTICGRTVTNSASTICPVSENPCISVTKNCNPPIVTSVGGVETFSGVVSNCGNITLTNVTLFDTFLNKTIATIATLPVGGSQPYTTNYTTVAADVGQTRTNTIIAVGRDACNTQNVTNQATCTFTVQAPPCINVNKEIACFQGTNAQGVDLCGTFSHFAIGVQGDTQDPTFCYRITVTNCADVTLTNTTVIDDVYGNLTSHFSCISNGVFPAHASCSFTFKAPLDGASPPSTVHFVTNTVIACGKSIFNGQQVCAQTNAVAEIIPAAITCTKLYSVDGGPLTNNAKLDSTHSIVWFVIVKNTGLAGLGDISVTDASSLCHGSNFISSLASGASVTNALCTNATFTCTNATGVSNTVDIVARSFFFAGVTNLCAWDINGIRITVRSECRATIECVPKAGCTPGFWKNCTIHWQPTGYRTDQAVSSVFSLGNCCTSLGNVSLLGALSFGGGSDVCGGAQILLRAAVAALLNASSPEVDYPFTAQQVISMVNTALHSCNRATMIALASELDRDNNLGCNDANGNSLPCHRLADVPRAAPTRQ